MRNFKWLLILLIGMVSFTGFSFTPDLTDDSSVISELDVDVGLVISIDNSNIDFVVNYTDDSWRDFDIKSTFTTQKEYIDISTNKNPYIHTKRGVGLIYSRDIEYRAREKI